MKSGTALNKSLTLPLAHYTAVLAGAPLWVQVGSFLLLVAYATMTDLQQEESEEFARQLEKQIPDLINKIRKSEDFQQMLIGAFEAISRERIQEKRELIRSVFFDKYIDLETRYRDGQARLFRVISEISIDSILHLKFIKDEILPLKEALISNMIAKHAFTKRNPREWWYNLEYYRSPLSDSIQQYIYNEYNINSPKVSAYEPNKNTDEWKTWHTETANKEEDIRRKFYDLGAELQSLGIFRTVDGGKYTFTKFGELFLSVANNFRLE